MLGIPFYAVNFEQEFGRIIDYFVAEYTAGRTPNPCIVCNTWLKFGKLFEYADSVGAEFVATGHYARLIAACRTARSPCAAAWTTSKDQSYVLFGIERRAAAAADVSGGRASQGGDPPDRRAAGLARGGKARQPGDLLRARPGPRPVRPPAPRRRRHLGRDRHHRRHGGRPTRRLRAVSRSASARAWAWRSASRATSCGSSREPRRVVIGTREELARRELDGRARPTGWSIRRSEPFDLPGQDPLPQPPVPAVVTLLSADRFHGRFSTSRATASPPGRRPSATRATACWAAAGSNEAATSLAGASSAIAADNV